MDDELRSRMHGAFAGHRGVRTRDDLLGLGISAAAIDAMVKSGRLTILFRGVYSLPGLPADSLRQVLAASRAAGEQAVVALQSAAALHGLARVGSLEPIRLLVWDSTPDALPGVVTHRTRRLEPCDVTEAEGIPVTTPARTLIDLAALIDRTTLTALVDDAMGLGIVNRSWLHRRATALRNGRRGVGILVALTADEAEGKFRSWLERRAAYELDIGGVPTPRWNCPIRDGARLIGIADACWPEQRLIAEFDGMRFHSSPDQRRADAERERNLVLSGWRVLRFTWLDVEKEPQKVVAALHQALTRGVSS